MNSDKKWIIGATLSIITAFAIIVAILWMIGLFDFTGTDASAKIVTAAITLVGSLIATLVSIIGIFLKHSIEKRNADLKEEAEKRLRMESDRNINHNKQVEKRLKMESNRNNDLKDEAEKRLKIDVATKAINLLSTSSGASVPFIQKAAVLFTLVNLGQHDLALTILRQMIETDQIDMNSAVDVINLGLRSKDETVQEEASEILEYYSNKLISDHGRSLWPRCLGLSCNSSFNFFTRQNIALACLNLIATRPYKEWDRPTINGHVVFLSDIWRKEHEEHIKKGVGIGLKKIVSIYPPGDYLSLPSGKMLIDDLRTELSEIDEHKEGLSILFIPIIEKLELWNPPQGDSVYNKSKED